MRLTKVRLAEGLHDADRCQQCGTPLAPGTLCFFDESNADVFCTTQCAHDHLFRAPADDGDRCPHGHAPDDICIDCAAEAEEQRRRVLHRDEWGVIEADNDATTLPDLDDDDVRTRALELLVGLQGDDIAAGRLLAAIHNRLYDEWAEPVSIAAQVERDVARTGALNDIARAVERATAAGAVTRDLQSALQAGGASVILERVAEGATKAQHGEVVQVWAPAAGTDHARNREADAEVELREMDRRTLYDRLRRAAGIPSVGRPGVFPVGRREERWLLARPGRLDAAIRFAASAPMLPCGYDGWAPPGATIEFAVTREAVTRYLRGLSG